MSGLQTHYYGDGHDHGTEEAPDAFDPRTECRAWRKAPRVIGGPSHTHVCRKPADHLDVLVPEPLVDEVRQHRCTCGHTW